ncbi:ABC transporter ATP-binding protein [Mycetocola tolaasinivorans]|uniref:ABC transporter ATP-binding protein n=1 Tax=Mycetocola tolaasinivorans TaxID=76635 RepID=A0A3L7AAB7_9MICO|nr:ABC transporter ATP-binding protein [Mycetocola tolaasinivorans]RLP77015.1 ABC transporter ATP-binding protein [Mycetocola tolaasinivorans]
MSTEILQLAGVSRHYGTGANSVAALRNVSLTVSAGEFVAVMGPSGSGKSSLLTLAGGLDKATEGEIFVEGTPLGGLSINELARLRRRAVGYVFQDFNLIPTLTALENVALPRELDGISLRKAQRQAHDALRQVGIDNLADRYLDQMSGGQQQRVAIARAIVGQRRLILADEPTGALDSTTGDEVLEVLRSRAEAGSAVIMVTHEARHAGWADRVVFLRDGRIVDQAAAQRDPAVLLAERSA